MNTNGLKKVHCTEIQFTIIPFYRVVKMQTSLQIDAHNSSCCFR